MTTEIANNVDALRQRIRQACERAGRSPDDVRLVAVSKTRSPEQIGEAIAAAGLTVFGESRVQEAAQKIEHCPSGVAWHFIGHLQRNKARPAAALFDMVHAVDSLPLLQALDAAAGEHGRCLDICLQVNVSGEASKFGVTPDDLNELAAAAASCRNLNFCGLMTIPPAVRNPDDARPFFRHLFDLRQSCRDAVGVTNLGLSMGMSHDFEIAIEEGANWIRVGSAIFGRRT